MATSGNPAKRAAAKQTTAQAKQAAPLTITSVDEWLEVAEGQVIELPSGKVVKILMPGMQAFLEADLIPNDLMPIVMDSVQGTAADDEDLKKMQSDPQMLVKLADAMDAIFCYCVTEPQFAPTPKNRADRVKGVLYADLVDMTDKSFVFSAAVGGTRNIQQFRAQQAEAMEGLQLS